MLLQEAEKFDQSQFSVFDHGDVQGQVTARLYGAPISLNLVNVQQGTVPPVFDANAAHDLVRSNRRLARQPVGEGVPGLGRVYVYSVKPYRKICNFFDEI